MSAGRTPMGVAHAREIVRAWLNNTMTIEGELNDDVMGRVQRPPNTDEIREAFRTLAIAPETTSEQFAMFVAGNYRMFVAQTQHVRAREANRLAKRDLDAWRAQGEASRSAARSVWNMLIDLSPYLVIAGVLIAIYVGYALLAWRLTDDWLLPPMTRSPVLLDIAVVSISFAATVAIGIVLDKVKQMDRAWFYVSLVSVPWAVALTLHALFA